MGVRTVHGCVHYMGKNGNNLVLLIVNLKFPLNSLEVIFTQTSN